MGDKVELSGCLSPGARRGWACLTLGAEGLPTEVALERLLAGVCAQVHVEVGLLGEGMAAELTDIRPFIPVLGLDVHLQSVAARGPVPAFLTHKELFSTMLKSLVQL